MRDNIKRTSSHSRKHGFKKILCSRPCGLVICLLQLIITMVFLAYVLKLNILPLKYFIVAVLITLLLFLVPFCVQSSKKLRNPFKIISIIISVIMIFVLCKYLVPLGDTLKGITGANTKESVVSVYVLKSDPTENLYDMKEYNFAYLGGIDGEMSEHVLSEIEKKLESTVKKTEYTNYELMVKDLFLGNVDAIVLNEVYESLITDVELQAGLDDAMLQNFKEFRTLTKKVFFVKKTDNVDVGSSDKNVSKDAFIMYISGIDTYGSIAKTSRSDVNILAVINPKTRQILLVNTPRDSFVYNMHSGSEKDKLTHAAIYGIDSSIDALEKLYGIDIDYFFRVNFTGFISIVDYLGGINVYSEYAFVADSGDSFKQGYNKLNGKQALAFCRERHAFAAGDRQRGKNQMAVITAFINSLSSSSLLYNYSDIINGLRETFETSMGYSEITSLIKNELNASSGWSIKTYSVDGVGSMEHTFTAPRGEKRSVIILNQDTVNEAISLMRRVMNGEKCE